MLWTLLMAGGIVLGEIFVPRPKPLRAAPVVRAVETAFRDSARAIRRYVGQ